MSEETNVVNMNSEEILLVLILGLEFDNSKKNVIISLASLK